MRTEEMRKNEECALYSTPNNWTRFSKIDFRTLKFAPALNSALVI